MAKTDFIPQQDTDFLVWHAQFTADRSGGVMENWNDAPQRFLPINPTLHHSINPFLPTVALGNLLGIEGPDGGIDLSTRQPDISGTDHTGGAVEIGFNKLTSDGVNIYSKREGDADFVFLACGAEVGRRRARDTQTPYLDNRPLKVPGKPEIREYKAMFVVGDQEIGIFSHELVVNCAP